METIAITKDIRFVNVGEDPPRPKPNWVGRRQWNACVEYGFISAGQGLIYSQPLLNIKRGDILAAYITGRGYVGIGQVIQEAIRIENFKFNGKTLKDFGIDEKIINGTLDNKETVEGLEYLRKNLFCNSNNEKTEYAVGVKWLKSVDKKNAFWKKNYGLFANQSIQCTLKGQCKTIAFLKESFKVELISQ